MLYSQSDTLAAQLPERVAPLLLATQKQLNASHVIASASAFARAVIPRTAALLDVAPISEISAVHADDTFERPTYAGNAIAKVWIICKFRT